MKITCLIFYFQLHLYKKLQSDMIKLFSKLNIGIPADTHGVAQFRDNNLKFVRNSIGASNSYECFS